MEAFLVSTGIVALAEIGDKTQLLALVLASKYRKPVPIIFGIFVATVLNHFLAGAVGVWVANQLGPRGLSWVIGASFIAMAIWVLIPDKLEESKEPSSARFGAFVATVLSFFVLEMGDKTQIATIALAAKYEALTAVVFGTTIGMMIANIPAVLLGEIAATRLNMKMFHAVAAAIFLVLGILVLIGKEFAI